MEVGGNSFRCAGPGDPPNKRTLQVKYGSEYPGGIWTRWWSQPEDSPAQLEAKDFVLEAAGVPWKPGASGKRKPPSAEEIAARKKASEDLVAASRKKASSIWSRR